MKKVYLLNLIYDVWRCQMWFSAEDTAEMESAWQQAREKLPEIGENAANPQKFVEQVSASFRDLGFLRIHK